MTRNMMTAALSVTLAFSILAHAQEQPAREQQDQSDEQFMALAQARAQAELAIRKTRNFFEEADARWRTAAHGIDSSRQQVQEAITRAIQDEQRRPEEMRNQALVEDLTQRQQQINQDYQRFAAIDRPAIDSAFTGARQTIVSNVSQVYQSLTQIEPNWKEARVDLAAFQTAYDAVARRAAEVREQAEKALADLENAHKTWANVAAAATQPAQ